MLLHSLALTDVADLAILITDFLDPVTDMSYGIKKTPQSLNAAIPQHNVFEHAAGGVVIAGAEAKADHRVHQSAIRR